MKKCITTGAILLVLAFTLAAASFAWFSVDKIIDFPDSYGAIDSAAYFAGGDGTKDHPYIINSPVHLYNLAWLQYLGYFNMKEGFNNGVAQNYFELADNINMDGMCLPPIGTEEYPFVGIFNGNGNIISNINVSNKKDTNKDTNNITQHPTNAVFENNILRTTADTSSDKQDIQIVGLFGVVGDYNKYVSGETEGYKNKENFKESEMSVSGFYIDNLHVKTHSNNTLVGLIAGYVGANVKNTGVYRCDITAGNNTAVGLDGNACISKYSIVGDYDANIVQWKELQNVAGTPGTNTAWGGSMDIKSAWDRVSKVNTTSSWKGGYIVDNDPASGYAYLKKSGVVYLQNSDSQATYIPLLADEDGKVLEKNTGFIVGGSTNSIRLKNFTSGNIGFTSSYNHSSNNALSVYTSIINESGNVETVHVSDSYNSNNNISGISSKTVESLGFIKYEETRANFGESTLHNPSGTYSPYYGLHFIQATIGKVDQTATVLGKELKQLTTNSIDCFIKSRGFITFFAATNYSASSRQNFFSVHEVFRNEDGSIAQTKEISLIYKPVDGKGAYLYQYKDGSYSVDSPNMSNYALLFDCRVITTPTESDKATLNKTYYFEIPVNAGEYALGSCSEGAGAYLMYLDIGANGSGDDGTTEVPSDAPYTISYLDFVSPAGNNDLAFPTEKDEKGEYIPAYDDVIFALSGVANAEAIVWFKRENWTEGANPVSTVVLYYSTNITVAPTPADKASESDKAKNQS